jgi:hypothetical protein
VEESPTVNRKSEVQQEEISAQQKLLEASRRTLAHYLRQQLVHSTAYTPPAVTHGIYEAREEIRRIKITLRGWGVEVDDHPNDAEADDSLQQGKFSEEQLLWLSTALRHSPDGEQIDTRNVLIELLGKISDDFDPRTIDSHFATSGNKITVLGRYLIDPNDQLVQKANKVALAVRDILRTDTTRNVVTAQELAATTGLPESEVAWTLQLMSGNSGGGYFHKSGTSYGPRGWATININEDDVFENYVKFQGIEKLVKRHLKQS